MVILSPSYQEHLQVTQNLQLKHRGSQRVQQKIWDIFCHYWTHYLYLSFRGIIHIPLEVRNTVLDSLGFVIDLILHMRNILYIQYSYKCWRVNMLLKSWPYLRSFTKFIKIPFIYKASLTNIWTWRLATGLSNTSRKK